MSNSTLLFRGLKRIGLKCIYKRKIMLFPGASFCGLAGLWRHVWRATHGATFARLLLDLPHCNWSSVCGVLPNPPSLYCLLGARRRPWYRKRGRFQPDSPHVLRACDKRHGAVKQVAFTFPSYCPLTFLHFRCSLAGITDKWLLKAPKLVKIEKPPFEDVHWLGFVVWGISPAVCIDNRKPFPSPFIVV